MTEVFVALCAGCGPIKVSDDRKLAEDAMNEHEDINWDEKDPKRATHSTIVVNVSWISGGKPC